MKLDNYIRAVPDFPVRGVLFRDLTPMMADHAALQEAVRQLVAPFLSERIDMVAGVEARGFIFGVLAAAQLGTGFMPLRKLGKLPGPVESVNYQLEYGDACLQAQRNTLAPGSRVLIVDDVLATGGTLVAASELVARLGVEVVGLAVIMELVALRGRPRLSAHRLHSVMTA
jgi:adenine phosphoribosyltransferase